MRKGGLGKGLDAIIPGESPTTMDGGATLLPINHILPNPRQPRVDFASEELQNLAASIREHGILQPLIVTYGERPDEYVLIAGERRLRAATLVGLKAVPAIIRQVSEQQRLELALIENIQRANLNALETAEAYRQLVDEFSLSHEEVSQRVGKSRVAVTNSLRLLKLPADVRQALAADQISEGHARALLGLSTAAAQSAALATILRQSLNVRQTEELVKRLAGEKTPKKPRPMPPAEVIEIEDRLRQSLGTKVNLHHGKKGGSVVIYYYSDEELEALISNLLKE